ncbi:MAG: RNA polymerase sigma factor [Syntrophobacteria bacterium]
MAEQRSSIQRDEELALVRRCRRGDQEAFARLMHRYEKQIYNFTYRMLGSIQEAEDLTQDIFLAVFQNVESFRAEAKFSTWLYRIALNRTLNRLKYLSKRNFFAREHNWMKSWKRTEVDVLAGLSDEAPSPEQWTAAHEVAAQVQLCLNKLPPQSREILVLRDVQGFSYEELGEMLLLNQGTVKSRLYRARLALQRCLAKRLR